MVEKITALVFSALLLILSIIGTVHTPSVDNIVAIVFSAIAVIAICITIFRKDYVLVEDEEAKGKRDIDNALKLANEIKPYIRKANGKITIKIKK